MKLIYRTLTCLLVFWLAFPAWPEDSAQYEGAELVLRESLASSRAAQPVNQSDIAQKLHDLATWLSGRGRYGEAATLLREQLVTIEEVLGPKHPDTATSLNSLGMLLRDMGDLAGAKPYYERSLAIREEVLGPKHPDTATSLNSLGYLLQAMGDFAGAKPYYERSLAIREEVLGPKHPDTAISLNSLGSLFGAMGDFAGAKPYFERSLAIKEKMLGPTNPSIAISLNNLGVLLQAMGDLAGAKPYFERSLAIKEKMLGPKHPGTAISLNNLGSLLHAMGDLAGAKPYYERSLAIKEKMLGPKHPGTAISLNSLGSLFRAMGDFAGAKLYYERSLAIREEVLGPKHPDTATSLNSLGVLLRAMGDFAGAKLYYERSLAIREEVLGPKHLDTALSLNNLGSLLHAMGDLAGAKPYYERSLAINEEVLGPTHPSIAVSLNNLGSLFRAMGDLAGAKPYYERSLAINEEVLGPKHPNTAINLSGLGELLMEMGDLAGAKPYLERSLAIMEEVLGPKHHVTAQSLSGLGLLLLAMGDPAGAKSYLERSLAINEEVLGPKHPDTAISLSSLGSLLQVLGDPAGAKQYLERALAILLPRRLPQHLYFVEGLYAHLLADSGQTAEAIFFGKQAVNHIQEMRASMTSLDLELQRSFTQSKGRAYTRLADLLIGQGRLPEAQQVLAMLKDEEYFEFIRRDRDSDTRQTRATLTVLEASEAERLLGGAKKLTAIGLELLELEKIKEPYRSAEQRAQVSALRAQIEAADAEFMAALDGVHAAFADIENTARREELALGRIEQDRRSLVAALGERVVLLQYLVLPDKLYVLMTTARTVKAHTIELGETELNRLVAQLQENLRSPAGEVLPPAQALYEHLITPVAEDLAAMNAETVMVSLDGTLRYVPFGVLHDGNRYLIEQYAVTVFTEAASQTVLLAPNPDWYLAGFGVSKAHPGFSRLDSVPGELEGIVRRAESDDPDGVIAGVILLDEEFTANSFRRLLRDYPVVHIASHFMFRPGNEENSFLLLGDGAHLNLGEIRTQGYDFSRVELLTLSACKTAVASARARGGEIEGFGTLAQQRGARGVLATLWSVADASTASFMQTMYRMKSAEPHLNKAEMIRRTQLSFLRGDIKSGVETDNRLGDAVRETANTTRDWRHPFYWAPFILMGNWL